MEERIKKELTNQLAPEFLEVKNNSSQHFGHLGDDGSGETHFAVVIKATSLNGLTRVVAHRKIKELLKDEFARGLHALEIRVV
jgi:BolA protein